jgi:F-box and WD-40 domain protein CDC4
VATCLLLTPRFIVVALDNAIISIFGHKSNFLRNLHGHRMGVWALAVHHKHDDILASGGVDRDVHVWDMDSG